MAEICYYRSEISVKKPGQSLKVVRPWMTSAKQPEEFSREKLRFSKTEKGRKTSLVVTWKDVILFFSPYFLKYRET